jgi:argonaute-like protein implicated in RNA metabolism and viral defense
MPGIIMGLLARAGNVPYLLGEPLDFADYVVGLDLIHQSKRDGDELTGIARVFRNDGALLYFAISSAPLSPGEGIPLDVLATLLPEDYFKAQRVVLHCAGSFSREALWALGGWEDEIGATFYPVELIHEGVPYIYALAGGKIKGSPAGTVFRLNVNEAFVATTAAGDDDMPQPLHVRSEPPLTIEQALRSVMMFTRLHYGATNPPPLPVTIHNAEYIRESINRGVMPDTTYGDLPFWL